MLFISNSNNKSLFKCIYRAFKALLKYFLNFSIWYIAWLSHDLLALYFL
jgi:hypothetical protein